MYLKKIELHGFKSFADKVNIEFQPGITGNLIFRMQLDGYWVSNL